MLGCAVPNVVVLNDLRDVDLEVAHLEQAVGPPPRRSTATVAALPERGGPVGRGGACVAHAAGREAGVPHEADADEEHVEHDGDDG